jgi:RTC4-like domain
MAHSMDHFGPHIGSIACFDSLIATCGVTTYAREVLIPEMAVMLVKEDMGVDDAKARRISGESSETGELLNDENCDEMDGTSWATVI